MAGYLLNLSFDLQSSGSANGLFNDNAADPQSKKWFTVPSGWPGVSVEQGGLVPVGVNSTGQWPWPSPANPLDSNALSCSLGDALYIRLAYRNWGVGAPVALSFSAVFGRASAGQAVIASPFVLASGRPQTMYVTQNSGATDGAWIYSLGTLTQNLPGRGRGSGSHSYSFIVAAIAEDDFNLAQYGHDPKIVVGGGGGDGGGA